MTTHENERSQTRAVYVISVAAELAGMHPQTLRIYERRGLVTPARTEGGNRRYSDADIAILKRISELTDEGMNLEGIRRVMHLEIENARLRLPKSNKPARSPSTRSPLLRIVATVATSCRCARPSRCSVSARRSSTTDGRSNELVSAPPLPVDQGDRSVVATWTTVG